MGKPDGCDPSQWHEKLEDDPTVETIVAPSFHPDDPPYPIFGLPRIVTCEENLDRLLRIVDSLANSLCFCTGSLGCTESNDVTAMVRKYAAQDRILRLCTPGSRKNDPG